MTLYEFNKLIQSISEYLSENSLELNAETYNSINEKFNLNDAISELLLISIPELQKYAYDSKYREKYISILELYTSPLLELFRMLK